jgi:serine phosphatase RsbU (regulator of sigma subunit)
VQRGLLPRRTPDIPGWEMAGLCVQARGVGGDFYDWYQTPQGCWQFTMADVMGKGMGAALIAATTRAVLRGSARSRDLGDGFRAAASLLDLDLSESGTFVTALHGRFDPQSGQLDHVDAGHGLALHVRADGSWRHLASGSLPLGVDADEGWVAQHLQLEPGDLFLCGSDGLLEIFDDLRAGAAAVVAAARTGAEQAVRYVAERASGDHLADDVSLLVIRRLP